MTVSATPGPPAHAAGSTPPVGKSLVERLLSPIADVHPGEATTALLLTLLMFLVLAAYYELKTAREVFILSRGRRRGEELLVGRAGASAARSRPGLRRLRVAG